MDDVIDLRTRLIYASLADHELVRQLKEARAGAPRPVTQGWTVDLRESRVAAVITPPSAAAGQHPSEWATDDPSDYLG
jgi:hypothetical protein